MKVKAYKVYKGVAYFAEFADADAKAQQLGGQARVVNYMRGFAVQLRRSGPYWPEKDISA